MTEIGRWNYNNSATPSRFRKMIDFASEGGGGA
jgi:hypothetical protein